MARKNFRTLLKEAADRDPAGRTPPDYEEVAEVDFAAGSTAFRARVRGNAPPVDFGAAFGSRAEAREDAARRSYALVPATLLPRSRAPAASASASSDSPPPLGELGD